MQLVHRKYDGEYFGSYPSQPKPKKQVIVVLADKGVRVHWGFTFKPQQLTWDEVLGFDYTGDIVNGLFTTTLKTVGGDIVLERASFHGNPHSGEQQLWADNMRRKLNKIKRYVAEQTGVALR